MVRSTPLCALLVYKQPWCDVGERRTQSVAYTRFTKQSSETSHEGIMSMEWRFQENQQAERKTKTVPDYGIPSQRYYEFVN